MKILNLTDEKKGDIRYKVSNFPSERLTKN